MCFCAQDGATALHLAAQEGNMEVVRLLTEAGAQLNIQTEVEHWYSVLYTCIT